MARVLYLIPELTQLATTHLSVVVYLRGLDRVAYADSLTRHSLAQPYKLPTMTSPEAIDARHGFLSSKVHHDVDSSLKYGFNNGQGDLLVYNARIRTEGEKKACFCSFRS